MADPVKITIPEGQWTVVATNVTSGVIHRRSERPGKYIQTYRDTGTAAPTVNDDGVELFADSSSEPISSTVPIDIYVWAVNEDGEVRVDL